MQTYKHRTRFLSLALCLALLFTVLPAGARAAGTPPPVPVERVSTNFFTHAPSLNFGPQNSRWVEQIRAVYIDGSEYHPADSTLSLKSGTYVLLPNDGEIVLPPNLSGTVTCVIRADGYEDLNLKLDTQGQTVSVVAAGETSPTGDSGKTETVFCSLEEVVPGYLKLTLTGPERFVEGITGIHRLSAGGASADLRAVTYKPTLDATSYYLDADASAVYFNATPPALHTGDILRISGTSAGELRLRITMEEGRWRAEPVSAETAPGDNLTLHVRLVGSFEPALERQKGYDAVTGATSSVSVNKNSSVEVQCALVKSGEAPAEQDWVPLHQSGLTIRQTGTSVAIAPQGSGMRGVYSTLDSSLTLSGVPEQKGQYQVSVTVEDEQGRRAVSNPLPFLVYGGDEPLIEQLTLDHAVKAQDGRYLYDMIPWSISTFGGVDETVTVPEEIKAWFGSHTSGTYGKLGRALREGQEPTQTLLIPAHCDLTLVNMDILSSVRLVVQSGGKLTLQDSVVQGVVEVENGGTFSMNYDGYHKKFLSGASINGQLRLNTGAVLENASIYSNTNFIANGAAARKNTEAVVAVRGDVTLKGQVFLRGDEAPTGTDPTTGRSYAGQTGLSVTGGTLTLADGALLAVYAGGTQAATSVGGTAIRLDGGHIAGAGTLVAVGGDSTFDRGGSAVEGSGTITAAQAFLQGGASFFPKSADITGGKALSGAVSSPGAVLCDGPVFQGGPAPAPQIPRWTGAGTIPASDDAERTIAYIKGHTTPSAPSAPSIPSAPPEPKGGANRETPPPAKTPEPSRTSHRSAASHAVRTDGAIGHGTVTVSSDKAIRGREITLTVRPDPGYVLESLTVSDRSGRSLNVVRQSETRYTFAMPASEAEVRAVFTEAPLPAAADPVLFRDVLQTDYFYDAVQWAVGRGVTQGTSPDMFSPDTPCTRAEAVTFLWRAAGSPAPGRQAPGFQDIRPGAYCHDAVLWAAEQGITGGTGAGLFHPERVISRAEAVAFLHRAAGSPAPVSAQPFPDVAADSYYTSAVRWASGQGVAQGTGAGLFQPDTPCTRAQIVTLLYRATTPAGGR